MVEWLLGLQRLHQHEPWCLLVCATCPPTQPWPLQVQISVLCLQVGSTVGEHSGVLFAWEGWVVLLRLLFVSFLSLGERVLGSIYSLAGVQGYVFAKKGPVDCTSIDSSWRHVVWKFISDYMQQVVFLRPSPRTSDQRQNLSVKLSGSTMVTRSHSNRGYLPQPGQVVCDASTPVDSPTPMYSGRLPAKTTPSQWSLFCINLSLSLLWFVNTTHWSLQYSREFPEGACEDFVPCIVCRSIKWKAER